MPNPRRVADLPKDLSKPVPTDRPGYLSSLLAGVDPRGTWTLDLGRRTDPKHYAPMQALGTVGGFLGGAAVVPGIIGGLARIIPMLKGRGLNFRGLGKEFWGGATDIYKKVWNAIKANRALRDAAAQRRALTEAETNALRNAVERNVTVGDVVKMRGAVNPERLQLFQAVLAGQPLTPEMIAPLSNMLSRGALTGGLAIGGAGGITGFSAYKQYALGQKLRQEQQEAQQRVEEAYRRGQLGKYSSERIALMKKAIEVKQYETKPLTSLTARSDHAANKYKEPELPNPLTAQEQAALDSSYALLPPSAKRVTDAHKRGRTTLPA